MQVYVSESVWVWAIVQKSGAVSRCVLCTRCAAKLVEVCFTRCSVLRAVYVADALLSCGQVWSIRNGSVHAIYARQTTIRMPRVWQFGDSVVARANA